MAEEVGAHQNTVALDQPSITSTPLPSLEASAPSNSLFIHENGDNFELWVHPDLPNRSALVNRIKSNGGTIVHDIGSAYVAIISHSMSEGDYSMLRDDPDGTVGISSEWVSDCIQSQSLKDLEDYIIWRPSEENGEEMREKDLGPEGEEISSVENGEDQIIPATIPRPKLSDKPPSAETREEDENFMLWAAPLLYTAKPDAPWNDLYEWCAANSQHRSPAYWLTVNHAQRPFRRQMDEALEGIKQSPSRPFGRKPVKVSSPFPRKFAAPRPGRSWKAYSEEELSAMVKHIALHPELMGDKLWRRFHWKSSQRSVPAYREYHRMHEDYFSDEVKRYMETEGLEVGIRAGEPSPSTSECDADKINDREGVKRNLSLGRRTGRGHALSEEEIRAMKAFYQQNHSKYSTMTELWELFGELHPTRTSSAWMNQVQRNGHLLGFPSLSAASSEDDSSEPGEEEAPDSPSVKLLSTSPERQKVGPFTEQEDRLLRVFGRKAGYPPTLGIKAWEEFSERHPSRSKWSWRSRYEGYIYPNRPEECDDNDDGNEDGSSGSESHTPSSPPQQGAHQSPYSGIGAGSVRLALKRLQPLETLESTPAKRARSDAASASTTESSSRAQIPAPPSTNSSATLVGITPSSTENVPPSHFTREDVAAAVVWVANRQRPKNMFQNMASWETFAEKHPSHDAEEWLQYYYSRLDFFRSIESRLDNP